jgi:rfaE bifunctional protein kinase chain/domain
MPTNLGPQRGLLPAERLARLRGQHVLVLGDVMIDEYLFGSIERISPEAPVPVLALGGREALPGGAANSAANVVALGGRATLVGAVGNDEEAEELRQLLLATGVRADCLLTLSSRPTTRKTRVLARGQHLCRLDREVRAPLDASAQAAIAALVAERLPSAQALLISDYMKGVVTPALAREVIGRARRLGCPVIVDPKGESFEKYQGASLVTPNVKELEIATGSVLGGRGDLLEAGRQLMTALGGAELLVTRGGEGMTLFEQGGGVHEVPAATSHAFDVTGAGDTVVAAFALGLAAGFGARELLSLASRAAGVAVSRRGATAVSVSDLLSAGRPS